MAKGESERVRRIGRLRNGIEIEQARHHSLHLILRRPAEAGHRELDLVRGVLHHLAAQLHRGQQGDPACLSDRHGGPGIGLEKDTLDDNDVGAKLADKLVQLRTKRREPARHGFIERGRDHSGGDRVPVRPI